MRKVSVRVGGGRSGRLVYWAYLVQGDVWSDESSQLRSSGFRFLPRKDKLGIMCYLLGLKSALEAMSSDLRRRGIHEQYLVKFYCINGKVDEVLSRWGYGLRDPLILGVVNAIKHLANSIGLLDLAKPRSARVEEELRIFAASQFYRRVNEILRHARLWDSSNRDGYVVCVVPADSDDIPLECLAKFLYRREVRVLKQDRESGELKGVVVVRECDGEHPHTRVFFYSPDGAGYVARIFKLLDSRYLNGKLASRKSLCITRSTADVVEEVLAEAFEICKP